MKQSRIQMKPSIVPWFDPKIKHHGRGSRLASRSARAHRSCLPRRSSRITVATMQSLPTAFDRCSVTQELRVGTHVQLVDLQKQPELNGTVGLVMSPVNDKGRVAVQIGANRVGLKPINLRGVQVDGAMNILSPDAPSIVERLGDEFDDLIGVIGSFVGLRALGAMNQVSIGFHGTSWSRLDHIFHDQLTNGLLVTDDASLEAELRSLKRLLMPDDTGARDERGFGRCYVGRPRSYGEEQGFRIIGDPEKKEIFVKPATTAKPVGIERFLLALLDNPETVGRPSTRPISQTIHALCVDILNLLPPGAYKSFHDPAHKAGWTNFGDWHGLAKHVGGVPGRGSLTHLDPNGHMSIFGVSSFDYNEHVEGGPAMRTRPKYSMAECGDPMEEQLALFRFHLEETVFGTAKRGANGANPFHHVSCLHPPPPSDCFLHRRGTCLPTARGAAG